MEAYIIINEISGFTSKQRCNAINNELWNLSRPEFTREEGDVTNKVFQEVELLDGRFALQFNPDYMIKVSSDKNLERLQSLFPDLSSEELGRLTAYIGSVSQFEFKKIIPQNVRQHTITELSTMELIDLKPIKG